MPTIRRPGSPPAEPRPTSTPPAEGSLPLDEHSISALHVPEDTTPTWELEMLVSGAVLVGLFQLPPVIDGAWHATFPRLPTPLSAILAVYGYIFLKGMVYALMAAFVVHLASRAYWVAMVGLDSVFPRGVRWEKAARYGPIAKELIRDRMPTLPRMISFMDNFCSVVFAVGFIAVSFAAVTLSLFTIGGLVAWGASTAFFGGAHAELIMALAVWLLILPVLVMRVERRLGARLSPGGRLAAAVRGIMRSSIHVSAMRLYGPILLTLTTNVRRRLVLPFIFALLFGSMTVATLDLRGLRGESSAGVFPALPQSLKARVLDYRHYADQRTGNDAFALVPFIQSDVVRDPYVRLFIPYNVRQDRAELQACMRAGSGSGAAAGGATTVAAAAPADAAERCLASIRAVALNGRARTDLDYRYYTDATSGLQGLLVYVPVGALPRGRNLLTVRRPPQPDENERLVAVPPDSITFWL